MDWGFIWIMVILKIPLFMVLGVVFWAIKSAPDPLEEPEQASDDGGPPRRHPPRPPAPIGPRRGPHGHPAPASPPRTRAAVSRSRVTAD